jgi:hypothetical protein
MKNEENTTTKELPMVVLFQGNLRDWFAGQAMAGMNVSDMSEDKAARWAYDAADAMLKARAQ